MTTSSRIAAGTLLALLCLVPLTVSLAQQEPTRPDGDELIQLDFAEAQLTDVIETISRLTGTNFLYDERVRGTVTLITESKVTVDEAYQIFESILQVKGFTTVPGPGGVVKIIPTRDAKQAPIETTRGAVPPANRDLYVTRLIPLKFIRADNVVNSFRQLISQDAALIAYAPTNTLILTDTMASIRRMLTIIAEIDVESYREQIKVIPLQFADAQELVGHLESIFAQESTGAGAGAPGRPRRARREPAAPAGVTPPTAGAALEGFEGVPGEPRFIADDRTNSIIVLAPRGVMGEVEKLVSVLDYKRQGAGRIHVVRLQNADAEEMAKTLSTLGGGGAGAGVATARVTGQAGPVATQAAVAELAGGVKITADAPTNSLIIEASTEGVAALRDVIDALDIRRPQVMVEALIMEVDVDDSVDLGAGVLINTLLGSEDTNLGLNFGINVDPNAPPLTTDFGNFAGALLGNTITVPNRATPDPTDVVTLPVIQGLLTASAGNQNTNIISAPVILTADNEEAQIVVGENIPIPVSQVQTPTGTTATGQFNVQNQIERRDVGVTLRVTPQISEGDTVRLDIFQEISEVQGATSASQFGPDTTNRTVENTVYVRDGEAVMIGGILQENLTKDDTKIPWLGDIPILGWAFRRSGESLRKTNLLIVLTPHIVRDPKDLERLTTENRERFRNSAGEALDWDEKDLEERRKALAAGVDLPRDVNPVRRELDIHTRAYPTEELSELSREHAERESERLEQLERAQRITAGAYLVHVSTLEDPADAVRLLTSLIGKGYDGVIVSHREGERSVHVVQLGPYPDADRAQAVAREVRAETGLHPHVVVEP
jgi:general secretion pathway protein D